MQIEGGPRTTHGGSDNADCSGALSYVRCEFAGYPFKEDQEINAITFGSVGSGTQIDHVQVSYSNDDSFEWFGGAVNAKYLVSYHTWDDDFDTDNGFCGKVQFCLGVRHPRIADTSASNGFESDNNGEGSATSPFTSCVFSNVTFVGPVGQDAAFSNTSDYITAGDMNPKNGSQAGPVPVCHASAPQFASELFQFGGDGFPRRSDRVGERQRFADADCGVRGTLKIQNVYMAGMTVLGSDVNKSFEDGFCDNGDKNSIDKSKESLFDLFQVDSFEQVFRCDRRSETLPAQQPASQSELRSALDSPLRGFFTDPLVANGFDEVTYIGAFADEKRRMDVGLDGVRSPEQSLLNRAFDQALIKRVKERQRFKRCLLLFVFGKSDCRIFDVKMSGVRLFFRRAIRCPGEWRFRAGEPTRKHPFPDGFLLRGRGRAVRSSTVWRTAGSPHRAIRCRRRRNVPVLR